MRIPVSQRQVLPVGGSRSEIRGNDGVAQLGKLFTDIEIQEKQAQETLEATRALSELQVGGARILQDAEQIADPQQYKAAIESQYKGMVDGITKNISPNARAAIEGQLIHEQGKIGLRAQSRSLAKYKEAGDAERFTALNNFTEASLSGNINDFKDNVNAGVSVIRAHRAAGIIETDLEAEREIKSFRENAGWSQFVRQVNADPIGTRGSVDDMTWLTAEQKIKANAIAERQAEARERDIERERVKLDAKIKKQQAKEDAIKLSDLQLGLDSGAFGHEDIEKAWDGGDGWLDTAKRTQLHLGLNRRDKANVKIANDLNYVHNALSTNTRLIPKEDEEALSNYIDQLDVPEDQRINVLTEITSQAGILPEQGRRIIRASINGSQQSVVDALDYYDKVSLKVPTVLEFVSEKEKVFIEGVKRQMESGTEINTAIEGQREILFKQDDATIEQREVSLGMREKTFRKDNINRLDDIVDDNFDTAFIRQPDIPMQMAVDFNEKVKFYAHHTNDLDLARDMAEKDILTVYGATDVNGKREIMKRPPENYYGEGSWMREQLISEVKGELGEIEGEIFLVSDPTTLRERYPSYQIWVDRDGEREPLFFNGEVRRWIPDFRKTEEYTKMIEKQQKAVEKARKKHEYEIWKKNKKEYPHKLREAFIR